MVKLKQRANRHFRSELMSDQDWRHWRLDMDLDGVCWLTLDRDGEKVNSLSREVLDELADVVTQLEADPPTGLVLQSGKRGSFIVGADVREFDGVTDPLVAAEQIHQVHQLFNRIEALAFPTVVIIEGFCLGGGLELALAFDYRIARDVNRRDPDDLPAGLAARERDRRLGDRPVSGRLDWARDRDRLRAPCRRSLA
jgi:1,4-dihydroxy-2-naphthoyl-CoA synthase